MGVKKTNLENKERTNLLTEILRDRTQKQNKNAIIIIVGGTGSGKSYAALRIAEMSDPNFNINNIVFDSGKFMELIQHKADKMPPGSCIVFDEGGVAMQSRQFMSKSNIAMSFAMQTVRHRNHIIIITVPKLTFVDSQVRSLAHYIIEMVGIDHRRGYSMAKIKMVSAPAMREKVYHVYPVVYDKNHGLVQLRLLKLKKPSVKLRNRYEAKKTMFTSELYAKHHEKMVDPAKNKKHDLTPREQQVYEATKWGLSAKQIKEKLGIVEQEVYNVRTRIRQKGYLEKTTDEIRREFFKKMKKL